jgi:hypothetical protein
MPVRRRKSAPMFVAQGFRTEARGTHREKRPPLSRCKHKRERVKKEVLSWLGEYRCQQVNLCCHTISMSTIFSRAAESRWGILREAPGLPPPAPHYSEHHLVNLSFLGRSSWPSTNIRTRAAVTDGKQRPGKQAQWRGGKDKGLGSENIVSVTPNKSENHMTDSQWGPG